jgi:hypothetical protein
VTSASTKITSKLTDDTKIKSKFITSIPTNGNAETRLNKGKLQRTFFEETNLVSTGNHIFLETSNSTAIPNSKYISVLEEKNLVQSITKIIRIISFLIGAIIIPSVTSYIRRKYFVKIASSSSLSSSTTQRTDT